MMKRLLRWRWALLIGALLLLGLGYAFWPAAESVDVGEVTRGPMQVGISDDGVTRATEYYIVSAPVTGYLSRIELEPGDRIARGTLITLMQGSPPIPLDSRSRAQLRAALTAARAAEQSATSSLTQSRRDLKRAEQLSARGFLPKSQLEAARTRKATDRAALDQARAGVRQAQAALAEGSGSPSGKAVAVRAPAGGSVLSVITESEGVILEGTPLVTIGDPGRIEAVVDLLSREAVKVQTGDRVEITQWGGPEALIGRVERVEPFGKLKISALGIEEQRVNVIVRLDPMTESQAARLGHGYQVDARIILWSNDNVLRVPLGALFRGEDRSWQVFVVSGSRARARKVEIGHINDEFGEVANGLTKNDVVILNPSNSLRSGDRVRKD